MPEMVVESPEDEKDPLPAMSFLDHLEELSKRIIYSIISVGVGFCACWWKVEWIYGIMQRPITDVLKANGLSDKLVYLNPTEPFNLYLKVAALAGLFLTSPFVLYQVWLFISPGLYRNEKRYVVPFMVSTIGLFSAGGFFGYRVAYPVALDFLIKFGKQFTPMITVNEYTQLFLSIVLGMGLIFELPVLVFFLALMGIVTPEFMWKNFRYSILVIFIVAAIVTPTTDIMNMCIFAAPMIALSAGPEDLAFVVSAPSAGFLAPVVSPASSRTTRPTCVGGTVADGTTNSFSLIMRSSTSAFGHSAHVTSFTARISPGLMVRPATSTFTTPCGFSSCTTAGWAWRSRNTLTRNAAAPASTKAMTASMMTDGLMEKPAPLPTKILQRGLVRVSAVSRC